jgi:hypothetical protein
MVITAPHQSLITDFAGAKHPQPNSLAAKCKQIFFALQGEAK